MFDRIMYFSLLFAMFPGTDYAPYILWPDNFSKIFLLKFFSLFLTTLYSMWNLSSPTRIWIWTSAMKAQSLNWTTRKVPDHIIIDFKSQSLNIIVVQSLSHVLLFATPWTPALQASLSFTISQSLLRFMSTESVMLPNHLILHLPLLSPIYLPSHNVLSPEAQNPFPLSSHFSIIYHLLLKWYITFPAYLLLLVFTSLWSSHVQTK